MNDNIFGIRLKQAREEKEITMEDLAKAVGVTKGTIWKYESGRNQAKAEVVKKISDFLNVSLDWLIGYSEQKDPEITTESLTSLFNSLNDEDKKQAIRYMTFLKNTADSSRQFEGFQRENA